MTDRDERVERVLPELRKHVDLQIENFEERIPSDLFGEKSEELIAILSVWLRPFFETSEMDSLAKRGVTNILKSMGYNPEIDKIVEGYSGNEYQIAVIAPTPNRLLIVDQMVLSSIFPLVNQMPKTFEHSKVTVADFFKYIDITYISQTVCMPQWTHPFKTRTAIKS